MRFGRILSNYRFLQCLLLGLSESVYVWVDGFCVSGSSYVGIEMCKTARQSNAHVAAAVARFHLTNETSGDLNLTKLDRIYFYSLWRDI